MDLETMEAKLDANAYSILPEFLADAQRIFDNCRRYNAETSNYAKNANKLEKYLQMRVKARCLS
jgi:histone acetyltransferase